MATAQASFTFAAVKRVPLPMTFFLCLAVVGGIWWYGTRNYDFLKAPSAIQIELARMRAAGELAQPSDLFAVEPIDDSVVGEIKPPAPPPEPPAPTPTIELGDLSAEPKLDAWTDEAGKPAASFINLASKLEADTQMTWALLGWERVLDHSSATAEEREIALNGIRRLRPSLPPWNEDPEAATEVLLIVDAPGDRLKLSLKAVQAAADKIEKASSGLLSITASVRKARETPASPKLKVVVAKKDAENPASVETPAPEDTDEIENAIISSVFKLVGSELALRDELSPISTPQPGEAPAEAIEYRITRLTWQKYAESVNTP